MCYRPHTRARLARCRMCAGAAPRRVPRQPDKCSRGEAVSVRGISLERCCSETSCPVHRPRSRPPRGADTLPASRGPPAARPLSLSISLSTLTFMVSWLLLGSCCRRPRPALCLCLCALSVSGPVSVCLSLYLSVSLSLRLA